MKEIERHLSEAETYRDNKHMKKCPVSLLIDQPARSMYFQPDTHYMGFG